MWNDQMIPQKHPIESVGGRNQIITVFGEHDALDKLVDGRTFYSGVVLATVLVCRRRSPVIALFVPG